jgi:hypothetical protein
MLVRRNGMSWAYLLSSLWVLGSCSSESSTAETVADDEPGALSGELAVYIADLEDGTTDTYYALRDAAGNEQKLLFDGQPDLDPGARVKIWGRRENDALRVTTYKASQRDIGDNLRSQGSALIGTAPRAPRKVCPVLVEINGGKGPANVTIDSIQSQFLEGPSSVNAFYIENSYGKDSLTGKTYGPFPWTAQSDCDTNVLANGLRSMIPDTCDQYQWVLVPHQNCPWAGLAQPGTPNKPARDTWYNASLGCVVTVQEPGHNFGMSHSSSMTCPGGAWFADDLTGCTHSEYGNRFDPMGGGCRHMNVWEKQYEGWFGGCNAVKVTSSGTFNLLPTEKACDGVQSIQLPFPGGKKRPFARPAGGGGGAGTDTLTSYFLEYRTPIGLFDKGMTAQVLVHVGQDPVSMAGATRYAPHTWILNASQKGITTQPGLLAGNSFSDPAGGLTVTVDSLDPDKAVIRVEYANGSGAPTCFDNTELSAPGPTTCVPPVSGDGGVPPVSDSGMGSGGRGGSAPEGGAGKAGAGGGRDAGESDAGATGGMGGGAGSGGASGGGTPTGGAGGGDTAGAGGGETVGGSAGSRAGSGPGQPPPDVEGGCSCRIGAPSPGESHDIAVFGILGLAASMAARSRRKRSQN